VLNTTNFLKAKRSVPSDANEPGYWFTPMIHQLSANSNKNGLFGFEVLPPVLKISLQHHSRPSHPTKKQLVPIAHLRRQ
jgi:hypothetical protein